MKAILFLLIFLSLSVFIKPTINLRSPWKCTICEDVVQTYHDKYQCKGNFLSDFPLTKSLQPCTKPFAKCDSFMGSLKTLCEEMKLQFRSDTTLLSLLINKQLYFGDSFKTCQALAKCSAEDVTKGCPKVFSSPKCRFNINCPEYTTKCSEACYMCNWVVKEWPLFRESCKTTQTDTITPSAPPTTDANVQTEPVEEADLSETCFSMYDEVSNDNRALYFMTQKTYITMLESNRDHMLGRMWDAHVVCKCLGHCQVNPIERLTLIEACQYGQVEERAMEMLYN